MAPSESPDSCESRSELLDTISSSERGIDVAAVIKGRRWWQWIEPLKGNSTTVEQLHQPFHL